jgi:cytochrome c peroxidase
VKVDAAETMLGADEAAPLAPLPDATEVNAARADLGNMLFFDPRMSGAPGSLACASD